MRFRYSVQAMIAALGLGAALLAGVQTQTEAQADPVRDVGAPVDAGQALHAEPKQQGTATKGVTGTELAQRRPGDLHGKTFGTAVS